LGVNWKQEEEEEKEEEEESEDLDRIILKVLIMFYGK
jgi:hypothetical protein